MAVQWFSIYVLNGYHLVISYGVSIALYILKKREKRLSQTPTWLIIGIFLTLFTTGLDAGGPVGREAYFGHPFRVIKFQNMSISYQPLHFIYNLLFYTVSSCIVARTYTRLDNIVPFNSTQKAGVIIASPYIFLQIIRLLTTPLASSECREVFGLTIFGFITRLNSLTYSYLHRYYITEYFFLLSFVVGILTLIMGTIEAILKKDKHKLYR